MRRITIDIEDIMGGFVEIKSDDMCITYINSPTIHGLQCNFNGDTKEYNAVMKKAQKIAELVRELDKIYK